MLRKSVFASLLSIGLVIAASLVVVSKSATPTPDSDKDAVLKVLMLEAESIEKNDIDSLNKIWSPDDSVLIFENGGIDKGWKNYRDHHLAPELRAFKNTKFSISDAVVSVDHDTAWATYRYSLDADYKERKIESKGLGTMVFEKTNGKWLIVHSHTSRSRKPAS
ncbi:MAG: DUF4440 domain-containing protein [Acidobacteria bacterium]|nr:MAG: DUF4440 domain-containing protein [Acidobacteriota bacterium]REJ98252.1 MAG: DUF4440 domain-containing protein [Acidobacteriota bacterium]REK16996.1 MAG: DUF4440 domain-containing protein [Acidobacteriota bacterium]REK42906.1 MAG: DUF4440 domain-containing protein [Acidobacteriota bacterium]